MREGRGSQETESRESREHVVETAGLYKESEAREREVVLRSWRRLG